MIPQNISRGDVIKAIKRIQAEGIPNKRQSSKFDLLYQCFRFPPKLILSIANEYANGEPLDYDLFSSGDEANTYLSSLGFEIVLKEPEKVQLVDPEEEEFPEGKVLYRRHCTYEPDRRLVTKAKQRRKRETGSLDCEV
ncbi:hypothetical protein H6F43_12415, partial [Leptolyngbya sp. FACHB-36]